MTGDGNSESAQTSSQPAPNAVNDLGFAVGQTVIATVDLVDLADDERPTTLYAEAGDELIVRQISWGSLFKIGVSHPNVTDRCFGVRANEIRLVANPISTSAISGQRVAPGNSAPGG